MNDGQWQQAWEIYTAAADLGPDERGSFLASIQTDPETLGEVLAMFQEAAAGSERTPESRTGTRVGRYAVGALLGAGGMGEVYAAADPELGRPAAIKFLNPEMAGSERAVERLIREAKSASALNHPHIITVYEVIRTQSDVAIAMELVEGRALRKVGAPVDTARVVNWGRQIAQALAAAHQRNIIHRDIKPENLMVRDDGIVKVLDFGLAAHFDGGEPRRSGDITGSGGTLHYMSPEQIRSQGATAASDVFSLGVVLYELATGIHPFRSPSPLDTAHAIAHAEPKPPSSLRPGIPAALGAILSRMLSKDPAGRPSAIEVERQLSAIPPAQPRRSPLWTAAALAAIALLFLAFTLRTRFHRQELQFVQVTRQVNENRVTTAALSPDGTWLLFATFDGRAYRCKMSEGSSRPLDLKGLRVDRLAWFQDGSKILIDGSKAGARDQFNPGIWLAPAAGGEVREVIPSAANGTPSPDGSRIVFTSADGSSLWIASASGEGRREIRDGGDGTTFSSLFWSPDGKRVSLERTEYVPPARLESDGASSLTVNRYRYSLESLDVASGRVADSSNDFVMQSACAFSDGRVAFLRPNPRHTLTTLWVMRTDPYTGKRLDEPKQLNYQDFGITQLSASSDGRAVIALRAVNQHPNVYVADLPPAPQYPRFAQVRRLTFTEADDFPHAWTPDSKSVILESSRNGFGKSDLFRQDTDQSEAQPLAVSDRVKALAHVAADGKWILFNERETSNQWGIMRMPLAGGPEEKLFGGAGLQGEYTCATHPDGRCVLRTVQNREFVFWDLDPVRGQGRELARTAWSPSVVADWDISPDGSAVVIPNHDPRTGLIKVIPLDPRGGPTKKTIALNGLKNLSGLTWAADGRGWYVAATNTGYGSLFYVDLQGRVLTNLLESIAPTFAVPSPDGRHVAFADWTVNANVWSVSRL